MHNVSKPSLKALMVSKVNCMYYIFSFFPVLDLVSIDIIADSLYREFSVFLIYLTVSKTIINASFCKNFQFNLTSFAFLVAVKVKTPASILAEVCKNVVNLAPYSLKHFLINSLTVIAQDFSMRHHASTEQ